MVFENINTNPNSKHKNLFLLFILELFNFDLNIDIFEVNYLSLLVLLTSLQIFKTSVQATFLRIWICVQVTHPILDKHHLSEMKIISS